MPSDAVLYQAAALCLTYPDQALCARLPLLREAAPQLRTFADHAAVTPLAELAAHYVAVFASEDVGDRYGLYLSRWDEEGARPDGTAAARFEEPYRVHGLELAGQEPPDFLPAVLEFTARTGDTDLLVCHRPGLERLRSRLTGLGTPYASVLDAVCAAVPAAGASGTGP
ncbi:nitrate reductase molybdenum cofactor assembly chaperone [Streptomyces sp. NPDC086766]|uniref:nitrate reductase molybdenum cofactor assembly chaperone n=1 Tax=Streptomyces sp. NPDC086766 TaxID=3365754 RepID=UPI003806461D